MGTSMSFVIPRQDPLSAPWVRVALVLIWVLSSGLIAVAQSNQQNNAPSDAEVSQALDQYFASIRDYKPGDLVSQSRVAAALDHVRDVTGWEAPDQDAIKKRALADNSFIVTQLSTANGRTFMRNIAKYPGTYARLDRLSTISGGQQFIKDLISKKGGSDMIEYLATTQGGHKLGAMMAGVQHGVDLNKPTGRIYTAEDLKAALLAQLAGA